MKVYFAVLLCVFVAISTRAQENKTVVVNSIQMDKDEEFSRTIYQYPQFITGQAWFKSGEKVEARFNYNYFTNQIVFIDAKGDTLALDQGEMFSKIIIQTDSFYFFNDCFLQQATHFASYNLFTKRTLNSSGTEKKSAYGMYSSTSSNTPISTVSNGHDIRTIGVDENMIYKFGDTYFIADKFHKFYPATKKGFLDLFWKMEKQIKHFIETNGISFAKKADLEKLLQYINTIEIK